MIQLVVSDFDGTIVDRSERLHDEFVEFLREARQRGLEFTIATGRAKGMTEDIAAALNISIPYIVCNGGMIIHQGQILQEKTFSLSPLRAILLKADQMGMSILYSVNGIEIPYRSTSFTRELNQKFGRYPGEHQFSESEWRNMHLDKLIIYAKERDGSLGEIESLCKGLPELYHYKTYGNKAIDILHRDSSKENGMIKVAKMMGVPLSDIMAIGDDMNDIGMLKNAGVGVAVGNAQEATKNAADYVTSNHYYKGVMEAVQKLCWGEAT